MTFKHLLLFAALGLGSGTFKPLKKKKKVLLLKIFHLWICFCMENTRGMRKCLFSRLFTLICHDFSPVS